MKCEFCKKDLCVCVPLPGQLSLLQEEPKNNPYIQPCIDKIIEAIEKDDE